MGFSGNFRFLTVISGNLISVEFSGIFGLVESGGFFGYKVDFGRNLRLIDLSGFLRLWFRVRVIYYRAFLLVMEGGK